MHLFSINPYTIFHELTISSPYPQNLEKWATSHENSIMTNDKVTKSTTFKKSSILKVVETTQEDLGTQKFYANVCMTECLFPTWKNDVTEDFFFSSGRSVSEGSLYPRGSSLRTSEARAVIETQGGKGCPRIHFCLRRKKYPRWHRFCHGGCDFLPF